MTIDTLDKTKRQRKEYNRMAAQLNFINNWFDNNQHIIRKNCCDHNIHIFQLHHHYTVKAIRLKKLLHIT